jgi:hypothetical protein
MIKGEASRIARGDRKERGRENERKRPRHRQASINGVIGDRMVKNTVKQGRVESVRKRRESKLIARHHSPRYGHSKIIRTSPLPPTTSPIDIPSAGRLPVQIPQQQLPLGPPPVLDMNMDPEFLKFLECNLPDFALPADQGPGAERSCSSSSIIPQHTLTTSPPNSPESLGSFGSIFNRPVPYDGLPSQVLDNGCQSAITNTNCFTPDTGAMSMSIGLFGSEVSFNLMAFPMPPKATFSNSNGYISNQFQGNSMPGAYTSQFSDRLCLTVFHV